MSELSSRFAARLLVLVWCFSIAQGVESVVAADDDPRPQVVYLHTEFMPHPEEKKDRTTRLGRELARQAFIIACEEELGVAVRDGSLDEAMPSGDDAEVMHLALLLRNNTIKGRKITVKLFKLSADPNADKPEPLADGLWNTKPLWKHRFDCLAKPHLIYVTAATVLEQAAKSDFVDALKAVGVRLAKEKTTGVKEVDEQKLLKWSEGLMEADFVKLFGSLRKIHGTVTETNESACRNGLLSRGYAQLNALTRHHYSSSEEAFAARAMLFAERMLAAADNPEAQVEALWHRAYVRSIVGLDIHAWDDLEEIRRIQDGKKTPSKEVSGSDKNSSDAAAEPAEEAQSGEFSKSERWKLLVEPFTKWDQQALIEIGDQHDELRPWSRRLAFQVVDGNRYPELVYEAATDYASEIPADYGMYAEMVKYGGLAIARTGARLGPMMLERLLPASLDTIDELPGNIKEFLPVDNARRKFAQEVIPDLDLDARFTPLGSHIASELQQESRYDYSNALSWSVLGRLIAEEQFMQADYVLRAANNATESSLEGLVDQLLPLVSDHRYADYIRSYRRHVYVQTEQCWEYLKNLKVRDPSRKMHYMILRYGRCAERIDPQLRADIWNSTELNFTTVDFLRRFFTNGPECREGYKEYHTAKGNLLRTFTKFSEAGWRMCICAGIDPDQEQLKEWEVKIKNDSMAFFYLGRQYKSKDLNADAQRCLKESVDLLPSLSNVQALAGHYYDLEDYENWEHTYLDYLETDPTGLKGARIHNSLAGGFIRRDMYEKALPHSRLAGQTYSAWGLIAAFDLTENLAMWEESERWAQALSTSYPSGSGESWYFWCRRTGRGDVAAARKVAARVETSSSKTHRNRNQWVQTAVFRLMEDDVEGALEAYRKGLSYYMSTTCSMMVSQLSRQLNDDESSRKALDDYLDERTAVEEKTDVDKCTIAVVRLAQSEQIDDEKVAEVEELMRSIPAVDTSYLSYFLGKEFLIRGNQDEAKTWFTRSMRTRGTELFYSSLAGMELARLNGGTSRRDDEVLSRKDTWPPEEETP